MPGDKQGFRRRQVLVVDDEIINRTIMAEILKSEYDVIFAENGKEALKQIRENKDTLSLVLLDILMPVMSGTDVLKEVKNDPDLAGIPIIVITSEQSAEVESLKLGAIDFIPKPYPAVDVILARVLRTIELCEDRDLISSTERDPLTGLYNREYFYTYAERYDQYHKDMSTDAILIDINHFHMINERYGKAYADELLHSLARIVKGMVSETGGIVCRRVADTFMVYCPHRDDYETFLESAAVSLSKDADEENRIHLRMGVYPNVDKSVEMERRFDRAKMAADTVRGSFSRNIGFYDDKLHEQELFAEQLIEEFPRAIRNGQFHVYYQPKFDIRPEVPILCSAEALVRWIHPQLGMISPGVFIPLFEKNGLIRRLDTYVWDKTAAQIRKWKDELGYAVPVSVNVSRVDVYDPGLVDNLQKIVEAYGLEYKDLILELTESAYTDDTGQILESVNRLRSLGFMIEMDDFGTGYSSLNMVSELPMDAMKLDMHFIRDAFKEGGNTHIIEVIMEIAGHLQVPVIAEGVENERQLLALKELGCDIVQGYFFSKPVPAEDFEAFILQKKEADRVGVSVIDNAELIENAQLESIFGSPIDEYENERNAKENKTGGIQLKTASFFFGLLAALAAVALLITDIAVTRGYSRMEEASDKYIAAQTAAANMASGSDYLTDRVRSFVVTGDLQYLDDFFNEINYTKTRDNAVADLERLLDGKDNGALASLNAALKLSNELVQVEDLAMRLMVSASDYDLTKIPSEIMKIAVPSRYSGLDSQSLKEAAREMVFSTEYMHHKDKIRENVDNCTRSLIATSSKELEQASSRLSLLVQIQTVLTVLFLAITIAIIFIINRQIRRPLTSMVEHMRKNESIPVKGIEELRYVTQTYNSILEENKTAREKLSHEASHDALTGLFNRGAYDMLMKDVDQEHMALIMIDVDHFKQINDTYGHDVGDRILVRVAEILRKSFRSVDIICRYGGDEFIVVMTRVNSSMRDLVVNKMKAANEKLQEPQEGLPPASLSVGVAFADRKDPKGTIFQDADEALYRVKAAGKSGIEVY